MEGKKRDYKLLTLPGQLVNYIRGGGIPKTSYLIILLALVPFVILILLLPHVTPYIITLGESDLVPGAGADPGYHYHGFAPGLPPGRRADAPGGPHPGPGSLN